MKKLEKKLKQKTLQIQGFKSTIEQKEEMLNNIYRQKKLMTEENQYLLNIKDENMQKIQILEERLMKIESNLKELKPEAIKIDESGMSKLEE